MTNFSKCLAVFATVASLAFLGVVSVSAVGGPNYESQLKDPLLKGVTFTVNVDEETGATTYSAESRKKYHTKLLDETTQEVDLNSPLEAQAIAKDSKVLPSVLVKAHEFTKKTNAEKNKLLDDKIQQRTAQVAEAAALIAIDNTAMDARLAELNKLLNEKQAIYQALEQDAIDTRTSTLKKRQEAVRRKNEINRLRSQVRELTADQFRLQGQKRKLEVLLIRLRDINARMKRREQNLIRQGAAIDADAKPTTKTPPQT